MNFNYGFVFGTWNGGSSSDDYLQLFRERENAPISSPNFSRLTSDNPDDKELIQSIANIRNKLLVETARELAWTVDVLALQEVSGNDRADIQEFIKQRFQIIRPPKNINLPPQNHLQYLSETDTAIIINPKKFNDVIQNRSFNDKYSGNDVAVAVAVEKTTNKKIAFVSAHITGFNLEEEDPAKLKEQASFGDGDIARMIEKLKADCSDCETIIVGVDINATTEKYVDRFLLFIDAGFQLIRTGKPTSNMSRNIQGKAAILQERELDYVFILDNYEPDPFFIDIHNPVRSILNELFKKNTAHTGEILTDGVRFTLDPISNPSDHIPVLVRVHDIVVKRQGLLSL